MNNGLRAQISVFTYENYKDFLRGIIKTNGKGAAARLAEFAGCQRSYLSDVLRTSIHLTPDHAYGIAEGLGLPRRQSEFFLTQLHHDRAFKNSYKERLGHQLAEMRADEQRITRKIGEERSVQLVEKADKHGDLVHYYSMWQYEAVHIACAIVGLQTESAISKHLGLPSVLSEQG